MSVRSEKWMRAMIERYGSEDAVRTEMKRRQEKSMLNPNRQKGQHRGGFSDIEFAKKAGERGRATRYGKSD